MAPPSRIGALYDTYLRRRPRQSRSRRIVEAILDAGVQALGRGEDEESIAVDRVAARAGVGIGSLYDYFSDRKSLLAGLAAKVTDDNRVAFEAVLERTRSLPLRESVELIVDHAFATFAKDPNVPRAVLRIAHGIGLMPTMAANHAVFARALAGMLRERTDVKPMDAEITAFVLTNALMGIVLAVIWTDGPTIPLATLREGAIAMCLDHLAPNPRTA